MKENNNHTLLPADVENRKAQLRDALGSRSIVLIGIMGSGKSTVGRRVAQRLDLPFVDADNEIETAANMSVSEIFNTHGEAYFRSGEERVIARLLKKGPQVLATGGGAYMSAKTRTAIQNRGISVWMHADLDTIMARVRKRSTRPLLQTPDPEGTMLSLLKQREPLYALADLKVHSRDEPHDVVMEEIITAVAQYLLSPGTPETGN